MQSKQNIKPRLPLKERSWFKLGLLFIAGFMVTFLAGFVWDVFSSQFESHMAESTMMAQPSTIAIDPKLEGELAKVMNSDSFEGINQTRDPFTDRNNLSSDNVATVVAAPAAQNNAPTGKPAANTKARIQTKAAIAGYATNNKASGGQVAANSTPAAPPIDVASTEATMDRARRYQEAQKAGREAGPISSIFAMNDLLPIGTVSGGDGQEEVIFFSQAFNRTMSFPVGSRFFDGWLVGFRPDGVELSAYGQNTTHLKGWGKETKANSLNDFSLSIPSNTLPE